MTGGFADWFKNIEQSVKNEKFIHEQRRDQMGFLYWDLRRANIETEGKNSIFAKLQRGEALTENEESFYSQLRPTTKAWLDEFSKKEHYLKFQKFYYLNTIRKHLLNLQTTSINVFPPEVQKAILSANTQTPFEKLGQMITHDTTNSKTMGIIAKRRKEVLDTVNELNRIADTEDAPLLSLSPFSTISDNEMVSLNGKVRVVNMPETKPGKTPTDRYYNTLIAKLKKQLGLRDDGMPYVDQTQLEFLSGAKVSSFDSLKAYLANLEKTYNDHSLNTLLEANRVNYDNLSEVSSDLKVYNFARSNRNTIQFNERK